MLGTFDVEKLKQGQGTYIWMGPVGGEDGGDELVEKARYEGNYKNGLKDGYGKMIYPSGDVYEGMWVENNMCGEGTYTYKATGDIYSGNWENNKKIQRRNKKNNKQPKKKQKTKKKTRNN